MVCPKCKQKSLKCTDTRHMDKYTRRRRECTICGFRFTTYEIDQETFLAKKGPVDISDDYFGSVLNCAVRYAVGRRTYMPKLVIDVITPMLSEVSSKTLWCFDKDLTDAEHLGGYGDPKIDEPAWREFHVAVQKERIKRGETVQTACAAK